MDGALVKEEVASQEIVIQHLQTSTAILQDIFSDNSAGCGHLCQHCGKIYKTLSTLHSHALLKHKNPDSKVQAQCVACDKMYPSMLSLKKHEKYKHLNYRCAVCYKSFRTEDLLDLHEDSCTKIKAPCASCGKVYGSLVALRNHIKYKHPEETVNRCDRCRRSFSSARRLVNHTASVHPLGATICEWCDKPFQTVAALQSHILYRHREDSARCTRCHKVFATKSSLTRHLAKNHTQREKYHCGECMLGFQSFKSLVKHAKFVHG